MRVQPEVVSFGYESASDARLKSYQDTSTSPPSVSSVDYQRQYVLEAFVPNEHARNHNLRLDMGNELGRVALGRFRRRPIVEG
jgi:hypothetical protein